MVPFPFEVSSKQEANVQKSPIEIKETSKKASRGVVGRKSGKTLETTTDV